MDLIAHVYLHFFCFFPFF